MHWNSNPGSELKEPSQCHSLPNPPPTPIHLVQRQAGPLAGCPGACHEPCPALRLLGVRGVRAYDTPKGTCIFRLQEHTRRLFDSAKIYWMDVPYSESEVNEACRTVVRENGLKSGYLRPLAFVGNVGLGLHPPLDAKADLMVAALPWGAYLGEEGLKTEWMCASPPGTGSLPTPSRPVPRRGQLSLFPAHQPRGQAQRLRRGLALDVNGYLSEGRGEPVSGEERRAVHPARHRRHPARHHPRHHHDAGARLGVTRCASRRCPVKRCTSQTKSS